MKEMAPEPAGAQEQVMAPKRVEAMRIRPRLPRKLRRAGLPLSPMQSENCSSAQRAVSFPGPCDTPRMVSAVSSRRHHLLIIEAVPARSRRLETCIETGADAFRPEPWTYAPAPRPIRSTGLGCSMRGFHASVRQTDGHDLATPEGLRLSMRFLLETATIRTTSLGIRRTLRNRAQNFFESR